MNNGYTGISFPGLGLEMNPSRFLELGPLTIHYYGMIIALGLVLAVILWLLTNKVKKTKKWHPIVFIGISALVGILFEFK